MKQELFNMKYLGKWHNFEKGSTMNHGLFSTHFNTIWGIAYISQIVTLSLGTKLQQLFLLWDSYIHIYLLDSTLCSGADHRKTSKLRVTGLWEGNSPVTGEFPAQRAQNNKTNNSNSKIYRDWFNMNIPSYQNRKSHCGDKTILRWFYLYNEIYYTIKISSYLIRDQAIKCDDDKLKYVSKQIAKQPFLQSHAHLEMRIVI